MASQVQAAEQLLAGAATREKPGDAGSLASEGQFTVTLSLMALIVPLVAVSVKVAVLFVLSPEKLAIPLTAERDEVPTRFTPLDPFSVSVTVAVLLVRLP